MKPRVVPHNRPSQVRTYEMGGAKRVWPSMLWRSPEEVRRG